MKSRTLAFILVFLLNVPSCMAQQLDLKGSKSLNNPTVRVVKRGQLTYVVGSIVINAPREKVWETLVDYDKSPEIFSNLSLCQVIGREGEVKLVRQLVKPGGLIKFDYVVNLTEFKPRLITWKRRSGSFKEVTGTWELEPVVSTLPQNARTSVTYSIHLDGGLALPPWLLASQVKGYLPTVLTALKVRVESAYQFDSANQSNSAKRANPETKS